MAIAIIELIHVELCFDFVTDILMRWIFGQVYG